MKAALSDFAKADDTTLDRIDYPLFRAMAAKVTTLSVTPEQFVFAMRYAVASDLYYQEHNGPIFILGMEIEIL